MTEHCSKEESLTRHMSCLKKYVGRVELRSNLLIKRPSVIGGVIPTRLEYGTYGSGIIACADALMTPSFPLLAAPQVYYDARRDVTYVRRIQPLPPTLLP